MHQTAQKLALFAFAALFAALVVGAPALSAGVKNGPSGLPIPRFVSIAQTKANMRVGPGEEFPVKWQYRRPGLPVEIIGEHGHWRKVRDSDGEQGFMMKQLLSGSRYALVKSPDGAARLRRRAAPDAYIIAFLNNDVIADIEQCSPRFCKVRVEDYRGWVDRRDLWGVYEDEIID